MNLPVPSRSGKVSLETALNERRTIRHFASTPVTREQISQLLWAAQGITDPERGLRTAPSAGAIYPIDLLVADNEALYRYTPDDHSLVLLRGDDIRAPLAVAAFNQDFLAQASVIFILAANYTKIRAHYGPAGIRYTDMEAGHIAQNIHLQAVSLGLASAPVGAFAPAQVKKLLALHDKREPVYLIPLGYGGRQ